MHNIEIVDREDKQKIILAGNPNVGKSVVFGKLTDEYAIVSNYPGTTVEVSYGTVHIGKQKFAVVDTPGTNSLIPKSEDEKITRDILFKNPHLVIQIADSKNLRRSLLLTFQLIEMGLPVILNLNMDDEAINRGIKINVKKLDELLGVKINRTIAITGEGIKNLLKLIPSAQKSQSGLTYKQQPIEEAIKRIGSLLPDEVSSKRACAVMLLSDDETIWEYLDNFLKAHTKEQIQKIVLETQEKYTCPVSLLISEENQKKAEDIIQQVLTISPQLKPSVAEIIGRLTTGSLTGIPILIAVLYLTFKFVGQFGAGTLVDFFEETVFGGYINPYFTKFVHLVIPTEFLRELLVGKYGLETMGLTYAIAIVLPIMTTFFLVFGFLEDSGYFPRLTILADPLFKVVGLTGKAVLPCVLGLGCGTMACLTCRILETKKERIIATLLLALGIPCSAQLGVMMGLAANISTGALTIIFFVIISQIFLVGYLAKKIVPGRKSTFIIELPPIRFPQISNILQKTYSRVKWFLAEAVPLFLLGTLILFLLDKFGILLILERVLKPVISGLLDLPAETTKAFILGFLRRDYGAAGLYDLAKEGKLDHLQIVVGLTVITLFVPCVANFFVMVKERGLKVSLAMLAFITPYAVLVGAVLNFILRKLPIKI